MARSICLRTMRVTVLAAAVIAANALKAQTITQARIIVSGAATPAELQAARMLTEEVKRRTALAWPITRSLAPGTGASILLAQRTQLPEMLRRLHIASPGLPADAAAEGFSVRAEARGRIILLAASDSRGLLFAAGYLLRHMDMKPGSATMHGLLDVDTRPAYPVRGHQLGYRPKNNTFDGWSAAQFEQYIRDLAVFGTNTIEIIPPRSDDDAVSPLYTLPPMQMMVQLSRILDRYGLDCSIWYPALDKDYSNAATIDAAVNEWGAVFDQLPRVDAVFVPGGDPGHTDPKHLFALLEREAARLRQRHPHAQMWVSPQSFDARGMEEFYALLEGHPRWLTGVVYGPEMRDSLEQFRRRVPAAYPIRLYPDITHTMNAQYPVPDWDPAFALTEGREPINPRPVDESILFHSYAAAGNGFVAYSEGSNDDVNKVLWSGWGWDPKQSAGDLLEEYARYFVSPDASASLAAAIAALEANWRGPLIENRSIAPTLTLLQEIELHEARQIHSNWRLQQMLYRGYYDAYLRQRLLREQMQERTALAQLTKLPLTDASIDAAGRALLEDSRCERVSTCKRLQELAADLFRTVRMQLSVSKYKALAVDRGANLDSVDVPLTDAPWLRRQLLKLRAEHNKDQRDQLLYQLLDDLGQSANVQYDDLGDVAREPHLVRGARFSEDPSGLNGIYLGVETTLEPAASPLARRTYAGSLYDRPLVLEYGGLEDRIVYAVQADLLTDARRQTLSAGRQVLSPACDEIVRCLRPSYIINAGLIKEGRLRLTFSAEPGMGGNGRSVRVAAVRLRPASGATRLNP